VVGDSTNLPKPIDRSDLVFTRHQHWTSARRCHRGAAPWWWGIGNLIYAAGGEHLRAPAPGPARRATAYEPITFHGSTTRPPMLEHSPAMKVARPSLWLITTASTCRGRDRPKYDIVTVEEFDPRAGLASGPDADRPLRRMPRCSAASSMYRAKASDTRRSLQESSLQSCHQCWKRFEPMPSRVTRWSRRPSATASTCRRANAAGQT